MTIGFVSHEVATELKLVDEPISADFADAPHAALANHVTAVDVLLGALNLLSLDRTRLLF